MGCFQPVSVVNGVSEGAVLKRIADILSYPVQLARPGLGLFPAWGWVKSVEIAARMESGPPGPLDGSMDLTHYPGLIGV